jgi:hypothetical protein
MIDGLRYACIDRRTEGRGAGALTCPMCVTGTQSNCTEEQYCWPGAFSSCDSVLVIFDDYPAMGADVQATLQGMGAFATVDTFDATDYYGGTPTASQLAAYHAVLVYSTGSGFSNAALLGDRLAAYHDQGGGVVVATYANVWDVSAPTIQGLRGDYGTVGNGYALLNYTSGIASHHSDTLGDVLEPQSPLMIGVESLAATQAARSTAQVIDRAVVVARWRGGGKEPLVVRGTRGGRTLVELNFYPPSSNALSDLWIGDGGELLRNALKYSRCMPCGPGIFAVAGNALCLGGGARGPCRGWLLFVCARTEKREQPVEPVQMVQRRRQREN